MDRRTGQLWLVGLLLAVVAVAAAVTHPEVTRVPVPRMEYESGPADDAGEAEPEEEAQREQPRSGAEPARRFGIPGLGWLAGLGLLVLLGIGLAVMWRTTRGRITLRPTPAGASEAVRAERVRKAVAASLDELAADHTDPRAAVIGCWLRLEKAAAEAGTRREASDTPADLVARMLAAHRVSQPVLDRLAAVYRQARYAPHEIGEPMRDEARAALRRIHAELAPAATPVPSAATSAPETPGPAHPEEARR